MRHGRGWKAAAFAALLATGGAAAAGAQDALQTSTVTPDRIASAGEALRLVDAWLEAQCAYYRVPALSAGLVVGDSLVWSRGYGFVDEAKTVPAGPRTLYGLGSISKLFNAVAVMQQVEAGRLKLDAPITDVLPWARPIPVEPDPPPITLRALLSHSSGLPRESVTGTWTAPDFRAPTQEELRDGLAHQQALASPFRVFEYSNLGASLAGEAASAAAHRPYAELVTTDILQPLGMRDTRVGLPTELYDRQLPHGYSALDRAGLRTRAPAFDARAYAPAAGVTSTVEDMAKFAAWQLRLLRTGRTEVLKASTLREMQRVQFASPEGEPSFGLGFVVARRDGETFVGHDGEVPGYRSALRIHPASGTAVVVLRNTTDGAGPYMDGIYGLLGARERFSWRGPPPPAGVALEAFSGRYDERPWGGEGVMVPWAGGLAYLSLPTQSPGRELGFFKPKGGDVFRRIRADGSEAEEIRFQHDPGGRVTGFVQDSNLHPRLPDLAR